MRSRRFLWLWTIISVVLLVASAEILILIVNFRTQQRANRLLQDARSLKVGESTGGDVLRIVRNYSMVIKTGGSSGCAAADESYSVRIANDTLNRVGFALPILRPLDVRPTGIVAMFLLQKGRLCYLSYSLSVIPGRSVR